MNETRRARRQHRISSVLIAVLLLSCIALGFQAWQLSRRQGPDLEGRRWLQGALDDLPYALVGFGERGQVFYANKLGKEMLEGELGDDDLGGYHVWDFNLVTQDELTKFRQRLEQQESPVLVRDSVTRIEGVHSKATWVRRTIYALAPSDPLMRLRFVAILVPTEEPGPAPLPAPAPTPSPRPSPAPLPFPTPDPTECRDPLRALLEFRFQAREHIHVPMNGIFP